MKENKQEITKAVTVINKKGGRDSLDKLVGYKKCTPEQKAALDMIMSQVDTSDPEQAMVFGDMALEEISNVSARLNEAMTHGDNAVFSSALEETLKGLSGMQLQDLKKAVERMAHKGSNKAVSIFRRIFQGKADPNSAVAIEERIREAVFETETHIEKLKHAQQHTPVVQQRIEALRHANGNAFIGTSLFIMAGRELLDRETAQQKERLKNGVSETSEEFTNAQTFITQLDHKLKILEQARAQSVTDTQLLNNMNKNLNDNRMTLQSLLSSEVPMIQRTIATAGMAVDTLRTTNAAAAFRDHLDSLRDNTTKMTELAGKAAEQGRVDNPERLQKLIDTMISFRQSLKEGHDHQKALEEKSEALRKKLISETTKTLKEQATYLANDNNKALTAGRDADQLPPETKSNAARTNTGGNRPGGKGMTP